MSGLQPDPADVEATKPPVQYVLVRKDMDPVHQMVHVGHACGESIRVAPIDRRTIVRVLHVLDETDLRAYAAKIEAKGFHHALVLETTGPLAGQATALAIEPLAERLSALGKLFWYLKPAKFEQPTAPSLVGAKEVTTPPRDECAGQDDCG